jgi:hypothetical protein
MRKSPVIYVITAVTASCSSNGSPTHATITEPTIWLTRSSTIDPTALPLYDQAFNTTAPQKGSVYVCAPKEFQQTRNIGPRANGPWIGMGTWDFTKKPFVQGNVWWDAAKLTITLTDSERHFEGNGLPVNAPTGVFPVSTSDPVYSYDRNPNPIKEHGVAFSIPKNPTMAASACCAYKQIGITVDGAELHLAFNSYGQDELASVAQDVCSGGSEANGSYHRHALSECLPGIHDRVALVGYALDGFGMFSPYDKDGKELTSADLDECHGTTSEIPWDGQTVTMYHYVMTRDFPYTLGCFRGKPTRNAFPPLGTAAPPEQPCL